MDEPSINPELLMASGDATIRHLYRRTATFVDTCDQRYGKNADWKIFSGTFVRIAQRLFVATVSHSIDNLENPSRFVLTTKNGHSHPNGSTIVLNTFATDHDRPDVGLIELDAELFQSFDGLESIGLDRISLLPPERHLSSLMGTPSETVKIHPMENGQWGVGGTLSGFTTSAIDHSKWPRLNLQQPMSQEIDLLVRYPNDSPDIRDDTGMQSELPNPHGVSGGGLWTHDDCQNGLWLPDNCKLVGIQSSWLKDVELVRLTKISFWLDLVYSNYPDLRDVIDELDGYSFSGSKLARQFDSPEP